MVSSKIRHISLEKLVPHPGNSNRMSRANFDKLVRNIEWTGRYEPLVVRPCPGRRGFFQIVNGHHRCEALRKLGRKTAEAVVWNVDDAQTDILLATLNRLSGRDTLEKKLALLQRLSVTVALRRLAKLLPQTRGQIERLVIARPPARATPRKRDMFAIPMVFFVDPTQEHTIEEAISRAAAGLPKEQTRAARRATALMHVARCFLDHDERATTEKDTAAKSTITANP
jgi:ParB-like chromosome segregation protein Spo0J